MAGFLFLQLLDQFDGDARLARSRPTRQCANGNRPGRVQPVPERPHDRQTSDQREGAAVGIEQINFGVRLRHRSARRDGLEMRQTNVYMNAVARCLDDDVVNAVNFGLLFRLHRSGLTFHMGQFSSLVFDISIPP